jgi:hypothetical protein
MRVTAYQRVRSSGVGDVISDCADCGDIYVAFLISKSAWRGALVLTLEQSTDGVEWVEPVSVTFIRSELRSRLLQVSNPRDQIRIRWTVLGGGTWSFRVDVGSADPNWPRQSEHAPAGAERSGR